MPAHAYQLNPGTALRIVNYTGANLDDISLRLPEGVYTTMRTYQRDRVLGLKAHLQRLVDSLAELNRLHPVDLPAVRAALREVIECENSDALRLRITVPFEGEGVYISVEPFAAFPGDFYTRGVRCVTSYLERHMPAAKHTSFIAPSRSARAEADPEIHEMLMRNRAGEILEGLSSNFFALINRVLHTAGEGVLEGVTRSIVLAEAAGVVPVSMQPIHVDDLPGVGEAFITSSGREVMPVRQVDSILIGDPGPVTHRLMQRYHDRVMKNAELP